MKEVRDSEIFKLLDKKGNIDAKCRNNLSKTMVNLGPTLSDQLKTLIKIFKDPLTPKAVAAVESGSVIIYYTPETDRLPVYFPFIKFKQNGVSKIAVDVSNYCSVKIDKVTNEMSATIDNKKLYAMLIPAYMYLTMYPSKDSIMPPYINKITSDLWAQLFCKVLVSKVGLGTNKDRLDAFLYFAQKYFLLNIMEVPEAQAEDIAIMQFKNKSVNPTAMTIAEACSARSIDMYADLITFCDTLFNADITGLRTMRLNGSNDGMTFDTYVRNYIQLYYAPSGLALASFPHFMWMLIAANNYAYIFNDAVIEKVCMSSYPKLMSEIYRIM